jgi:NAD+ synthase (glutamine-hydrolysing)
MRTIRISLAQINSTVGAIEKNGRKIIDGIQHAIDLGADLVAFPELAVCGYPPEDLLLMSHFIESNLRCLDDIIRHTKGITAIVGFVDRADDIFNAAAVIHDGRLAGIYHKMFLPNYGVFDEHRYFQAGNTIPVLDMGLTRIGLNICEDIWYPGEPLTAQALEGDAELIVNISASPYHAEKGLSRNRMLATRASDNKTIVAFVNMVGGQDELIFDGESMIFDQGGRLLCKAAQLEEDFLTCDLDLDAVFRERIHDPRRRKEKRTLFDEKAMVTRIPVSQLSRGEKPSVFPLLCESLSREEEILHALELGLRDYVHKNGFKEVVVGLSGGIDSALVAALAVSALAKDNVTGISMPSPYTSRESKEDARLLAGNLGINFIEIPIKQGIEAYDAMLSEVFEGRDPDVTEENIQARIRGNLLMALSNKFGWLVLTTGNKSETCVGYCTLYGDMAGGFALIKDVPKTLVYTLATHINTTAGKELIPQRIITKEPTAELRPGQKDTDSLPPYEVLDQVLQAYVEEDKSFKEIIDMGFEEAMVRRVLKMVDSSEYKRRQSPPGVKITPRALGKDRRLPISSGFSR